MQHSTVRYFNSKYVLAYFGRSINFGQNGGIINAKLRPYLPTAVV